MAMTRAEINAKSDKKRGVRVQSYKLHEETINKLNALHEEFNMSKTQLVSEGIYRIQTITLEISNQCKEKNFYADEYAAYLYDKLSKLYPNAKLTFIIKNEEAMKANSRFPYITRYGVVNSILEDIKSVCESTCNELIEKCIDRGLNSSPSPMPSIYPKEPKLEKIFEYLQSNGVNMFTYGWFHT